MGDLSGPYHLAVSLTHHRQAGRFAPWINFDPVFMHDRFGLGSIRQDDGEGVAAYYCRTTLAQHLPRPRRVARVKGFPVFVQNKHILHCFSPFSLRVFSPFGGKVRLANVIGQYTGQALR
jgi:hypothetical protein